MKRYITAGAAVLLLGLSCLITSCDNAGDDAYLYKKATTTTTDTTTARPGGGLGKPGNPDPHGNAWSGNLRY